MDNQYCLKQVHNPEFAKYFFSKYLPMVLNDGIEHANKELRKHSFEIHSYDINGDLRDSQIIKPNIKFEQNYSGGSIEIRLHYENVKIPMKKFKEYDIDYSVIMFDDYGWKGPWKASTISWNGSELRKNKVTGNLEIDFLN